MIVSYLNVSYNIFSVYKTYIKKQLQKCFVLVIRLGKARKEMLGGKQELSNVNFFLPIFSSYFGGDKYNNLCDINIIIKIEDFLKYYLKCDYKHTNSHYKNILGI